MLISFVLGLLGAIVCLVSFLLGIYVGQTVYFGQAKKSPNKETGGKDKTEREAIEDEIRAETEAFRRLQNYDLSDAYGYRTDDQ